MQIERIVCSKRTEAKLESKHHVTFREARQIFFSEPRIRFAEKRHTVGEDVYAAFGQTLGGRYLSVFFIYKPGLKTAIIISARDMKRQGAQSLWKKID